MRHARKKIEFGQGIVSLLLYIDKNPDLRGAMAKTILIVEDNESNMKMFEAILRLEGYETLLSTDGRGVEDLVRAHRPDLIIMDIHLVDHSGLELTKRLKADQHLKSIPVIAVTAFAMKGDEEKIMSGGCDAYLSKPIDISVFWETIKRFLARGVNVCPASAVA